MKNIKFPKLNNKGQGLIEYLIIVALVAVSAIAIMRVVGQNITIQYAKVSKALGAEVEGTLQNAKASESMYKKKSLKSFMNGSIEDAKIKD